MRLQQKVMNRAALAGALSFLGCGSARHSAEVKPESVAKPMESVQVDASYGTLSFRGRIDRADYGSDVEYRLHNDVTFHSAEQINSTSVIDLRECRFVASVPADSSGPWKMLHVESRPISVHLTQDGETAQLPELTFRLRKAVAAQARRVGLAVNDGHFMWPIPVNLQ